MTLELELLLKGLDEQARLARGLDSVALMDGCYEAARAELVARDQQVEQLLERVREARQVLLDRRAYGA